MRISEKHNVEILFMEVDRDHIHYMIQTSPNINLSSYVSVLKQYTTYHLWEKYGEFLQQYFWHEKTFWSDGYFINMANFFSSISGMRKHSGPMVILLHQLARSVQLRFSITLKIKGKMRKAVFIPSAKANGFSTDFNFYNTV